MIKRIIQTEQAPAAIGPYSQAIRIGDFLYTSGQIALDPESGIFLSGEIEELIHRFILSYTGRELKSYPFIKRMAEIDTSIEL